MQLQVGQAVSVFQVLLVIQRGLADVDPDDVRVRIAEREDGGLVSATTCDQDVEIRPIVPVRPEDAVRMHRVEPVPVCCAPRRQVLDGRWVSPPLALAADHVSARVVAHVSGCSVPGSGPDPRRSTRGIIGYPPPGGNPAITRHAHLAVCDIRLFWPKR
jgi:hypothetical protein